MKRAAKKLGITAAIVIAIVGIYEAGRFLFGMRELAYMDSAIGSMRELTNAAQGWADAHPQQGYPKSIEEMHAAGLIDETLRLGVKNRYRYTYIPKALGVVGRVTDYEIHGDPIDRTSMRWHFCTDRTGVLRYSEGPSTNLSKTLP
jgi:hypothetical protein